METRGGYCEWLARIRRIDEAFRLGDMDALRTALPGDSIPNGPFPLETGDYLAYAIYHSPLHFIRALLELGADPNRPDPAGYPPLIAAVASGGARPGATTRDDVVEVLKLLLEFGADPDQRGINDYTALHMAVAERNVEAIVLLLEAGANPRLRTRIDDRVTPIELAESVGLGDVVQVMVEA